jgi:hypothetical protein
VLEIQQFLTKHKKITQGSNLIELSNHITNETKMQKIKIGVFVEEEVYSYEISPKYSLLMSTNYYSFGIFVKENTPYYLLDVDGDSILDYQSKYLHVPYWVVSRNSKEKDTSINIAGYFDLWYTIFQNNESPSKSDLLKNITREYNLAGYNLSYINRDLIYLHYLYNNLFYTEEYLLCLIYLAVLENEIRSRFDRGPHIIIVINVVQSYYRLPHLENAVESNNMILEKFPDCIFGMVYQVLLETNIVERNRLRELLLRNYSEHWLVKDQLL